MKPCVLALGFFDGVHLGHGALLKKTRQAANSLGLTAAAVTFDRQPSAQLSGKAPSLLNTASERTALMRELYGIEQVYVLPFDEDMRRQSWDSFARGVLMEQYNARHIVCGYDFRFGAGGAGDAEKLSDFCQEHGLGFDRIEEVCLAGKRVSSTHIRALLQEGRMEEAVKFLGHPHLLTGTVVDGRKIGRTLGIPTANLQPAGDILLPKHGVYAARATAHGSHYPAVVNIGTRPTFGGNTVTVEPWLLDFEGNLYGQELSLEFHAYLREERQFASPEALKEEITRNAQAARRILRQAEKERSLPCSESKCTDKP